MGKAELKRKDLQYLIFGEIYQSFEDPKAKRKAFAMIEAAITCLSKQGLQNLTVAKVAREAGVARSLVHHYFASANDIQIIAIKYVRFLFQKIAVDALAAEKTPEKMLEAYVRACFYWIDNFRKHALVWLTYLHRCGTSPSDRELNTRAVVVGEERIAALIEKGCAAGAFHCERPSEAAKVLQTLICGGLVCYATENMPEPRAFENLIVKDCLRIAGANVEPEIAP